MSMPAGAPADELIDVLDAAGNSLSAIAARAEIHRTGLWHRTVHVWVMGPKNGLLLQKRSLTKESFPGLWDISAAGHITAGDTSARAAQRELEEELGITVRDGELLFLFSVKGSYVRRGPEPFIDNEHSDVYLVKTGYSVEQIIVDKNEVDEVKYMAIDDLKSALIDQPGLYVPHHEEYERLFEFLGVRP
jgi:isopentenyldiphosphate isomerase